MKKKNGEKGKNRKARSCEKMGKHLSKHRQIWCLLLMIICVLGSLPQTAEAASKKKISSYTVQLAGTSVKKQTCTLTAGQKVRLQIGVSPAAAKTSISFTSNNKKIAKVSKNGQITAVKQGTAKIKIKIKAKQGGSKSTWVKVKVKKANTYQKYCLLMEKDTTSAIRPDGFTGSLNVTTSDPSVISVNPDQTLRANAYGTCQITVTGQGQRADITMTVPDISDSTSGAQLTLPDVNGKKRTFTSYHQSARTYGQYSDFLEDHGCASCILTTTLKAYAASQQTADPVSVIDGIERKVAGEKAWKENHITKSPEKQNPVSMYGISKILQKAGVSNTYVQAFNKHMRDKSDGTAATDIREHLKKGKAVIFEARAYNRYTGKKTDRWTGGYHTMCLIGTYIDGRVLVIDSANRSWYSSVNGYSDGQRFKAVTLKDLMAVMFSCESKPKTIYFSGTKKAGGYIKINS